MVEWTARCARLIDPGRRTTDPLISPAVRLLNKGAGEKNHSPPRGDSSNQDSQKHFLPQNHPDETLV